MPVVSIVPVRRATQNVRVILDPEQRKRLGTALKALRVAQDLDQIDVARLAKISTGTVQTIEWGARKNQPENIDKVARALGTSLEALLQKPHIDPSDPLFRGLNREDFEIARAYHEATSTVRDHARRLLRDRDPQLPIEATADEVAAIGAQIARLSDASQQLVTDLVQQLERLEDRNDEVG